MGEVPWGRCHGRYSMDHTMRTVYMDSVGVTKAYASHGECYNTHTV